MKKNLKTILALGRADACGWMAVILNVLAVAILTIEIMTGKQGFALVFFAAIALLKHVETLFLRAAIKRASEPEPSESSKATG